MVCVLWMDINNMVFIERKNTYFIFMKIKENPKERREGESFWSHKALQPLVMQVADAVSVPTLKDKHWPYVYIYAEHYS